MPVRVQNKARTRRLLAVVLPALLIAAGLTAAPLASADETTVSYDTLRTGWDPNESGLGPSAVSASDFGQLFSTTVNGQVYAQPLVVAGTLITATENNWIYGMNPATGAITWSRSVGTPWPASTTGCGDLVPNIGITSTPVYDPATNAVFFLAKTNDGTDAAHPHWYMHSITPSTGAERAGWPVAIQGTPSNDPTNAFNPETANQRPGLLLLGGVVYAGFASHCDYGPYVGYVAGVKTTTPAMSTLWSTEAGKSNAEAGIWQSGGGLVSDGPGRIILATGNGVSPAPGPGTSPPSTLAESVVRLQVNADGTLTAKDFFSPTNNSKLDQDDTDFGSGGPLALPDGFGTTAHPHLLVQDGKDGRVYLLDRDNLGGDAQGAGGTDASVGPPLGPYNGMWGHPAFWGGDGGYVYDVENAGYLRALKYGVNGNGLPTLSSAATSPATFGYTSGSPVVTSSGTTSGSAIVWVVYTDGSNGANGQLRAYDALPTGGQLHLRYSAPIGTAAKFAVPATDGNRVYVGTRDGKVFGFGRPTTAALTSSPTDFGNVAVGSTGTATVTVTAARAVTISAVGTAAPFGATAPALPVSLATGQTLSVPVRFTPTGTGGVTGSLTFTTDSGPVALDLHGVGTQAGLGATPASLDFGTVPTGANKTVSVSIVNTGTSAVTITGSSAPAAPFSAAGFPANGSTIAAGASVSVSVTYTPTVAGNQTGALSVTSNAGTVSVPITGTAVTGASHLSITPNPVAFGSVQVGQTATQTFDIANTGNITLTLTKAAPPVGVFNTTTPVSEGQQLAPGDDIHQTVTFTPTAAGPASAQYLITGDDGQGSIAVVLTGTGVTGTSTVNSAAGKPTSSSSTLGGYPASNVTDADASSYWESTNNTFPQWIQVDLGSTTNVGKVTLKLPPATAWAARTETLALSGSLDGTTFSPLAASAGYTFDPATGNSVSVSFPAANARYVRATITGNTGWPAGQLSDFEVFATAGSTGSPALSANPTSLSFASTAVGAASATETVTISNTGSASATVSAVTATGDFTQTNGCSSIAAGASCAVSVVFHPTAAGARTGTLSVLSNATNSPATVALSGAGAAAAVSNLALHKATSESSHTQSYASGNATDGDATTYWESANNAFPQWLQVDLGSAQSVSRVVLKLPPATAWAARTQTIALTGSADGTTFGTVKAAATYGFDPASGNTVTITFPATSVRYLRVTVTSNSGWPAGQLSEVETYSS